MRGEIFYVQHQQGFGNAIHNEAAMLIVMRSPCRHGRAPFERVPKGAPVPEQFSSKLHIVLRWRTMQFPCSTNRTLSNDCNCIGSVLQGTEDPSRARTLRKREREASIRSVIATECRPFVLARCGHTGPYPRGPARGRD